ncbi:acyl-CoA thioesterase [Bradyrhizobium sp. CCBAU 11386]|uniref:acyl-CoA thioesterase n=1 Tax=Bradyrhizobium sp. CCBAU 11386 TaxID=1630837 RepID=UPI002304B5D8|nr:acyl-CoA thioesterase II [Bradyrhizobium sp. CCBAU 11386]MDA9504764.1 acyl-CoA thioesterase [Bradyrhizobium sp. CCBAU 11386]
MSKDVIDLRVILNVEQIEANMFRGHSPSSSSQRVFGGQLVGQAMMAASRTVKHRLANSLQGNFIQGGNPQMPILYRVTNLRDGKSYSIRRVSARQQGRSIFSMVVSFHAGEQSAFDHQDKMPDVPSPEKLTSHELLKEPSFPEMQKRVPALQPNCPFRLRPVEIARYLGEEIGDGRIHIWIKAAAKLPDDPALHMCALAYASDWSLLDTVMARYGRTLYDARMMAASLNHAIWFHRPFLADDWLLFAQDSPSAEGGRGFTRGLIFKEDGTLVASVAQEGSIRVRR